MALNYRSSRGYFNHGSNISNKFVVSLKHWAQISYCVECWHSTTGAQEATLSMKQATPEDCSASSLSSEIHLEKEISLIKQKYFYIPSQSHKNKLRNNQSKHTVMLYLQGKKNSQWLDFIKQARVQRSVIPHFPHLCTSRGQSPMPSLTR